MDRVTLARKLWISVAILTAMPAWAGIVFSPTSPPDEPDSAYPESRFGQAPARGATVMNMELEQTDRRPAGLEFGNQPTRVLPAPAPNHAPPQASVSEPPAPNPGEDSDFAAEIAKKGVQEVALIAGDLGYFPRTVFVSRDVPVRMFVTGASKNTLCIMMDSFQVRKQVRSQRIEEITFTPNVPGKFRFYCPVNGMEGSLIVKEFSSSRATASIGNSSGE